MKIWDHPYPQIKYGKVYTDTGSIKVKHKFTGQELDTESGLYYYGAKYYEPEIGRFISADSIVQDYTDPQTLNRYSYFRNNPVILTDPSGHLFIIDDIIIAATTYIAANAAVIAEGAAIGAAIGGAQAAVTGGNIGMGMLTGAVSGALFAGVAHPISAGLDLGAKAMVHAATGAIAGGINTAITGGNLSSNMFKGAVTSGFGTALSGVIPDEFGYQLAGRATVGGLIGGGIASSQGGDFWNGFAKGAASAATAYLCNDMRDSIKSWFGKYIMPYFKQIFSGTYGDVNAMAGVAGAGYLVNTEGKIYPYYCGGLGYGLTITSGSAGFTPGEWFVALQVSSGPVTTQYGYAFQSGPFSEAGIAVGSALSGTVCYIRKSPIN